jgi:ribonuclease HIII
VDYGQGPVIGVDESGKGDFFGPLVIAGVCGTPEQLAALTALGVRDSKTIADGKVTTLADEIRRVCVHDVVVVNPEKYNQLYSKIRNLNRLLGWGHARVIENLLAGTTATTAISDKFGDDRFIVSNLQEKGKTIKLIQMVRGEAHPAVAAASVIARAEFLRRMEILSHQFGMVLPRGASSLVDEAGRRLVAMQGEQVLAQVAKTHFKNYSRIVG